MIVEFRTDDVERSKVLLCVRGEEALYARELEDAGVEWTFEAVADLDIVGTARVEKGIETLASVAVPWRALSGSPRWLLDLLREAVIDLRVARAAGEEWAL